MGAACLLFRGLALFGMPRKKRKALSQKQLKIIDLMEVRDECAERLIEISEERDALTEKAKDIQQQHDAAVDELKEYGIKT